MINNKPVDVIEIFEDNEEVIDINTNDVTDKIINEVTEEVVDKNNEVVQEEVHMKNAVLKKRSMIKLIMFIV